MRYISGTALVEMLTRTMGCIDQRLINHGSRVAYIFSAMLITRGGYSARELRDYYTLALFHDIGAYKTDEIDRMMQFETGDVWQHSVYGYLFLKGFSPLTQISKVALLHHANCKTLELFPKEIAEIANLLNLADRIDMVRREKKEDILQKLFNARGTKFYDASADCFLAANERFHILEGGKNAPEISLEAFAKGCDFSESESEKYLKMLIYAIDFRSSYTVTHTVTTASVSAQLAKLCALSPEVEEKVKYGAMLHDLGKMGIPVRILESAGALDIEEMRIMRTHVALTERIFAGAVPPDIAKIALSHHEKLNGKGYPKGLSAAELGTPERIVAVADIISALAGKRSYKEAYDKQTIIDVIFGMAKNGLIDREIVELFILHYDEIFAQLREKTAPVIAAYSEINASYSEIMDRINTAEKGGS